MCLGGGFDVRADLSALQLFWKARRRFQSRAEVYLCEDGDERGREGRKVVKAVGSMSGSIPKSTDLANQ